MRITILSDERSWINDHIPSFQRSLNAEGHSVTAIHQASEIPQGDVVFYLGCGEIVTPELLGRNRHNLVVHESALPAGRGWSPLTWQILEGKNDIPISLFEAVPELDSGVIYLQEIMHFAGTELVEDLRLVQAEATIRLCMKFLRDYPSVISGGVPQRGEATYYARRRPADSRMDPDKTIRQQFNLLRTVDNLRYPAFFELNGETYVITIEKLVQRGGPGK